MTARFVPAQEFIEPQRIRRAIREEVNPDFASRSRCSSMCNVFFIATIMHIHMVLSSATRGAHQRLRDLCEGIARAKLRCEYEYDRGINAVDEAGVRASRRCRAACRRRNRCR